MTTQCFSKLRGKPAYSLCDSPIGLCCRCWCCHAVPRAVRSERAESEGRWSVGRRRGGGLDIWGPREGRGRFSRLNISKARQDQFGALQATEAWARGKRQLASQIIGSDDCSSMAKTTAGGLEFRLVGLMGDVDGEKEDDQRQDSTELSNLFAAMHTMWASLRKQGHSVPTPLTRLAPLCVGDHAARRHLFTNKQGIE